MGSTSGSLGLARGAPDDDEKELQVLDFHQAREAHVRESKLRVTRAVFLKWVTEEIENEAACIPGDWAVTEVPLGSVASRAGDPALSS